MVAGDGRLDDARTVCVGARRQCEERMARMTDKHGLLRGDARTSRRQSAPGRVFRDCVAHDGSQFLFVHASGSKST